MSDKEKVKSFLGSVIGSFYYITDGEVEITSKDVSKAIIEWNKTGYYLDYNACSALHEYIQAFGYNDDVYEYSKNCKHTRLAVSHLRKIQHLLAVLRYDEFSREFCPLIAKYTDEQIFARIWKVIRIFLLRVEQI